MRLKDEVRGLMKSAHEGLKVTHCVVDRGQDLSRRVGNLEMSIQPDGCSIIPSEYTLSSVVSRADSLLSPRFGFLFVVEEGIPTRVELR